MAKKKSPKLEVELTDADSAQTTDAETTAKVQDLASKAAREWAFLLDETPKKKGARSASTSGDEIHSQSGSDAGAAFSADESLHATPESEDRLPVDEEALEDDGGSAEMRASSDETDEMTDESTEEEEDEDEIAAASFDAANDEESTDDDRVNASFRADDAVASSGEDETTDDGETEVDPNLLLEEEGLFAASEDETEGFLPEATDDAPETTEVAAAELDNTELAGFEAADIEDVEFIEEERLDSILESILFASDRPVSLASIKLIFKGTQVRTDKIKKALDRLAVELAGAKRGVTLEEVPGGYQIRTKVDNMQFLARTLKARPFKLSGPALETLAIVAYKQPLIKSEIDEIRGVESGHLLRALMEKGLINFEGKSDLPGKPMQYGTTKKFLEIFGLRNLKELPTLSQIDELMPEGIDEVEAEKPTLSQITDNMAQSVMSSYSDGEDELMKITEQLQVITTSSDFFEQEKIRQRQKRDEEKAQSIREALLVNEEVSTRDRNWLTRYDEALQGGQTAQFAQAELVAAGEPVAATPEQEAKIAAFETDSDLDEASFDSEPTSDDEELAVPYHDDEDQDANT